MAQAFRTVLRLLQQKFSLRGDFTRSARRRVRQSRARLFLEPLEDRRLLAADLGITKIDTPDPAVPGGALTYTIQVTNTGDTAGTGTVADTFPTVFTGFAFSSSATNATGNTASGTTNINDVVTVQPGGSITYNVTGTIAPTATSPLTNSSTDSAAT